MALGAADACAAPADPVSPLIQIASDPSRATRDLGDLPPPADSDDAATAPASGSTVSSAQPIPELPIWAMLILCFAGLGMARFRRGRKDRLSPGLE